MDRAELIQYVNNSASRVLSKVSSTKGGSPAKSPAKTSPSQKSPAKPTSRLKSIGAVLLAVMILAAVAVYVSRGNPISTLPTFLQKLAFAQSAAAQKYIAEVVVAIREYGGKITFPKMSYSGTMEYIKERLRAADVSVANAGRAIQAAFGLSPPPPRSPSIHGPTWANNLFEDRKKNASIKQGNKIYAEWEKQQYEAAHSLNPKTYAYPTASTNTSIAPTNAFPRYPSMYASPKPPTSRVPAYAYPDTNKTMLFPSIFDKRASPKTSPKISTKAATSRVQTYAFPTTSRVSASPKATTSRAATTYAH